MEDRPSVSTASKLNNVKSFISDSRKCFLCHKPDHLAHECRSRPTAECGGRGNYKKNASVTKKVTAEGCPSEQGSFKSIQDCLYSLDEDMTAPGVSMVRVSDKGSQPQCV